MQRAISSDHILLGTKKLEATLAKFAVDASLLFHIPYRLLHIKDESTHSG